MSSRINQSRNYSSEILRSRYSDLLKGTVASKTARALYDCELLTDEELQTIISCDSDAKQHEQLLDTLTYKGIPMLTKFSPAIKTAKQQIDRESHQPPPRPALTISRPIADRESEEFTGMDLPPLDGDCRALHSGSDTFPMAAEHVPTTKHGLALCDSMLTNGHGPVPVGSATVVDGKINDCSTNALPYILSYKQLSQKMEAFTVLLFTFLSQLRVSIDQQLSLTRNESSQLDKKSSSTQKQGAKNCLSWITLDVDWPSMRDYFPAQLLEGVNPSADHFVPMRLSVLLDAFQQLFQKYTKLAEDNRSIGDLSAIHSSCSPQSVNLSKGNEVSQDQLKRLESIQRALANSEERCQQLVVVTQQWSAECADKDKLIAVQATQIGQLKDECDKIQKKMNKYKKHWMATKDAETKRVSDSQFEELRLELACRRELHDQVIAERDEAEKRATKLAAEVDELKDLVEELRDRLSNYKVQAQAKEPTIREMSHVLEENRKLKEELIQLQKQNSEKSDKLLAYETYVNELTSSQGDQLQHKEQAPPTISATAGARISSDWSPTSIVPKPFPRKKPASQQAMVTGGFGIPSHIKHEVRTRHPLAKPLQRHVSSGNETKAHNKHQLPTDYHRHSFDSSDDESSSVATMSSSDSRENSLKYSSLNGRGVSTQGRPGSAPGKSVHQSTATRFPQKLINDSFSSHSAPTTPLKAHSNQSYMHTALASDPPSAQGTNHLPVGVRLPPSLRNGAPSDFNIDDYTQEIHYPNNSGVVVKPLTDNERSFHHSSNGIPNGNETTPVQTIKEPVAVLPADSALYSFALDEKQCPVCQHVFVTLTEKEFNSHVALCFK